MRIRVCAMLAAVCLCLAPTASWADLAPYSQDFEGLTPAPQPEDPFESSLADDGWLFFGLVFFANGQVDFTYGPFPAPNHGEAISAVVGGQGGPAQGAQQLSVFSDYRNTRHGAGQVVETNVFEEQKIGAVDVGAIWEFEFDAKRGNIEGASTALAFFKTLHPTQFWLSRFITIDMTNISETWERYSLEIYIAPDIEGHIFQFGFLNQATFYEGSGIFYDNIVVREKPVEVPVDIKPESCPNPLHVRNVGDLPVAILGTADLDVGTIDPASIRLAGVAPLRSDYEDVGTPFDPYTGKEDCDYDCNELGPDGFMDLTLKFDSQEVAAALGAVEDRECVVVELTGYFWPAYGGKPIVGEDVIVYLGRNPGGGGPGSEPDMMIDVPQKSGSGSFGR